MDATNDGIADLVDSSGKILLASYRLRDRVTQSKDDIDALIIEVESLSIVSEDVRDSLDQASRENKSVAQVEVPSKDGQQGQLALTACQSALDEVDSIFQQLLDVIGPFSKPGYKGEATWAFDSATLTKKLDTLRKAKSTLNLTAFALQSALSAADELSQDEKSSMPGKHGDDFRVVQSQREKTEMLAWYKTSDPERKHIYCQEIREQGTGSWIFANPEFRRWKNAREQLLWLHAIPGAGKTILASTIIDHMQNHVRSKVGNIGPSDRVVYFYFDFADTNKQTLASLLEAIVYQLLSKNPEPSELVMELHASLKSRGRNSANAEELLDVCFAEAAGNGKTFLIIDALDESQKGERGEFFQKCLHKLLANNFSILITSRKEPDIENYFEDFSPQVINLEAAEVDEDVRKHVNSVIHSDSTLSAMPQEIQKEICDEIVAGAGGMFRWATCQLDRIKQCLSPAMIRAELQSMPETLDETYERILGSVPDVHRELVQSALKWLAFSSRPLLLEELAEAVVLRPGHGDFNPASSRLFTAKAIVDLCGVLVAQTTIDPHKENLQWLRKKGEVDAHGRQNFYDKMATVVSLSHYSVKEYLVSSRLQESAFSAYYASEEEGNSFIARSCLFYLTQFNQGKVASDLNFERWPLLQYAAVEWITHWDKAGTMRTDAILRQVYEKLFRPEGVGAYVNWLNIYSPDLDFEDRFGYRHFDPIKQSADLFPQPLYWAALLGDPLLMGPLISRGADIHARGGYFGSALGVAVFRGHIEVVENLLHAGASPNTECNRFGSVLQIAAVGGSKYMVERLLRAGADVNGPGGQKWGSALIAAAANQHHDIVSLLIDNGADLNGGVQQTGSALYGAAVAGDVKLARVLLAAGADVNGSPSIHDPSPLYGATKAGSLPLVKLLIAHGADANKAGPDDFSSAKYPLQIAAHEGLTEIVRILLSAGADVNKMNKYRATALDEAISHSEEAMTICKMLLDAGADINAKFGSTFHDSIFSKAVSYRRFDLARMLIDNGAELSPRGVSGAVIAYKKAPWVFEAFMERDVDVNVAAEYSGTPLSTPLHVAVMKRDCGDEYVVRKLLERGANVNAIDESHYTTPLVLAARDGSANIVRLLIEFGADIQRTINYSAFEMAIAHACKDDGSLEVAEILLESGFNLAKNTEMAPFWPIQTHKPEIIHWLSHKGLDLNRILGPKNRAKGGFIYGDFRGNSYTPIQLAAKDGSIDILQLLLELGADVNGPDSQKETTLHYGFKSGDKEVVRFLLDNGALVKKDSNLIWHAIKHDLDEYVPILIEKEADLNQDYQDQSPLALAFSSGKHRLVQYLLSQGVTFSTGSNALARELATKGSLDDLKFLLDHGLDPNSKRRKYGSLLAAACANADTAVLKLLIDAGVQLSGDDCQHAFGSACKTGHIEMIKFLIEHGADVDIAAALQEAFSAPNNLVIVELLMEREKTVQPDLGKCFQAAAKADCQKSISYLLKLSKDPSETPSYLGQALQIAASNSNLALCKWLIDEHDTNVNYFGLPEGSPLQATLGHVYSQEGNQMLVFRLLIERGANVNPPRMEKKPRQTTSNIRKRHFMNYPIDTSTTFASPLSLAIAGGRWGSAQKAFVTPLLDLGADANGFGGQYHSPLQAAAFRYPEMVGPLLDAGADVNATDDESVYGTALHAAAYKRDLATAKILLDHGADVNIIAGDHGTVLRAAAGDDSRGGQQGTIEMMNLLFEAGVDVHAQDNEKNSAVQAAAQQGNVGALEWLRDHGVDICAEGGSKGNAYRAALKNLKNNRCVKWEAVTWLEKHYGRDCWDTDLLP
ncbi:unnamed protein product [Clonostachys chloroleuca]|uniref:Nephrocystin 3-like N-terminal domain-containing protein n=1 Tax=Clonostachys chloroleuca TaxID=1926264 RepID=A0AA35Q396_9HYPO|nr:unnamed protein product [Clonostachys chloroleuca]